MARETKTIKELVEIARRRQWCIIIPTACGLITAGVASWLIPPQYSSTATILIEAQEVPREYVKANISSYADQRIQAINQQIMGAPRLIELIRRFDLYNELKGKVPMETIIEKMRKNIKLTPISAEVVDPRSGSPAQATIAFSISYLGAKPAAVQQVTNELAALYLSENVKGRDKQSAVTYRFLQDEMRAIQENLASIDRRIASFKQQNLDSLPEHAQVNVQSYEEADRQVRLLSDQLRGALEKEETMRSELVAVPAILDSNDKESLRQLKLRLNELKAHFSDEYPDVKKTKMEIEQMEEEMHNRARSESRPDNPAYVTLTSQLAGVRADVASLKRQIAQMASKRDSYQRRIHASPRVEQGYKAILVERENLQQKHDDLAKKALEANVAHGMEKEQLGERLTLVDPARLPQKPASPNVPAIVLVGFVIGLGSGVGLAAIKESGDDTVRSAEDLSELTGHPVLATIPDIVTAAEKSKKKIRSWFLAAFAVVAIAVCAISYLFADGAL